MRDWASRKLASFFTYTKVILVNDLFRDCFSGPRQSAICQTKMSFSRDGSNDGVLAQRASFANIFTKVLYKVVPLSSDKNSGLLCG